MARFLRAPLIDRGEGLEVTPFGPASRAGEIFATGLSETFRQLSDQLYPVIAADRKREAGVEAAKDVAAGTFAVRKSAFTIRDQEYNRAGATMAAGRLETAGIAKIFELQHKHRGNPKGFMADLRAYAAGVRAELMPVSAEIAEMTHNRLIERAMPFVERQGNTAAAIVRDKAEATMIELDAHTTALFDEHARNLFDPDPATSEAAGAAIDSLVDEWAQQFARVDADGKPVFTETEKAKALLEVRRRAVKIGVDEWIRKTDDLPGAIEKLTDGDLKVSVGGVEVTPSEYLSPQQYADTLGEAERLLRSRNSKADREERVLDDDFKDLSALRRFEFVERVVLEGPSADLREEVSTAVKKGRMLASDGEHIIKMIDQRAGEEPSTVPAAKKEALRMMYIDRVDPTSYIQEHHTQFSSADMATLLGQAKAIFRSGIHDHQKRFLDQLHASLQTTDAYSYDPAGNRRRIEAELEYMRRVYDQGEDPEKVYEEILKRANAAKPLVPDPDEPTLAPRSAVYTDSGQVNMDLTLERAQILIRTGALKGADLDREVETIEKWLRTTGESPDAIEQVVRQLRATEVIR